MVGIALYDKKQIDTSSEELKEKVSNAIAEYVIDNIRINATREYEGFDKYKDYMSHLFDNAPQELKDVLNIERIEIRKINSLYIYNIDKIGDYFMEQLFNPVVVKNLLQVDGKVVFSKSTQTIIENSFKMNVATETQQIQNNKIKTIPVYRLVLDIESYWDKELDEYSDLKSKMVELNSVISKCYQNCLTEVFREKLEKESTDDDNIFGGVK